MKLIIAGSRSFNNYRFLKTECYHFIGWPMDSEIEIVSGACDRGVHTFTRDDGTKIYGADGLGERFAKEFNISVKPFPADWDKYDMAAGPIRNEQMARYATHCIVFQINNSTGSKRMIESAKRNKLILKAIQIAI